MKVYEALARALRDHGVTTLFGLIGDGNLYFADAYGRQSGARFVSAAHEAGAVLMANGYASVSGRIGVATVTHGPGLANALPPVIDSVRSGMPMLIIAGDTASEDEKSLQKIAQRELVLPTGAGFEQVRSPETAIRDLASAVRHALVERRPVVLNVPAEFMWRDVDYQALTAAAFAPQAISPDPAVLDNVVGLLAAASRPILLAGRGAADSHARAALLRLAERLGAPVATTLRAMSLFRDEPYNLDVFGTLSSPAALDAIGKSDCIIAFGASLNPWTTDSGALMVGKRVIHCDTDAGAIGKHGPVDGGVLGDAATVADTLVEWLTEAEIEARAFRSEGLAARLQEEPRRIAVVDGAPADPIDFITAVARVNELVPADRAVVVDAGRFMSQAYKMLEVPDPWSLVHTCNFGSIGLGMGNAIGAAIATPDRPVLLVCGDGGFMLGGIGEFATAVQSGVDLIVLVLNDGSYGAEHIQFRHRGLDPDITTFRWPDFRSVAMSLGGHGVTVRTRADLQEVRRAVERRDRPLLIDVKLDPDEVPFEAW